MKKKEVKKEEKGGVFKWLHLYGGVNDTFNFFKLCARMEYYTWRLNSSLVKILAANKETERAIKKCSINRLTP